MEQTQNPRETVREKSLSAGGEGRGPYQTPKPHGSRGFNPPLALNLERRRNGGEGLSGKYLHTKKVVGFFSVSLAELIFLADSQKCVTARGLLSLKAQRASREREQALAKGEGGAAVGGREEGPRRADGSRSPATEPGTRGVGAAGEGRQTKYLNCDSGDAVNCGINTRNASQRPADKPELDIPLRS